jgi:hypothetical protein
MRLSVLTIGVLFGVFVQGQDNPATPAKEVQPIPPRASPTDYQAQGQAGSVAIGAEFTGHFVVLPQGTLSNEDYVVVETGLFGAPETRLKLSYEDFSLRINGKKSPTPSRPYGMVIESLKDPEYEAPAAKDPNKPKTTIGSSGRNSQAEPGAPPPVVHIPIEVQRAMAQRVQKASLPEGDRVLPQAGLLFFEFKGKAKSIHSLELIYNGPAGKVSFELRP